MLDQEQPAGREVAVRIVKQAGAGRRARFVGEADAVLDRGLLEEFFLLAIAGACLGEQTAGCSKAVRAAWPFASGVPTVSVACTRAAGTR